MKSENWSCLKLLNIEVEALESSTIVGCNDEMGCDDDKKKIVILTEN